MCREDVERLSRFIGQRCHAELDNGRVVVVHVFGIDFKLDRVGVAVNNGEAFWVSPTQLRGCVEA